MSTGIFNAKAAGMRTKNTALTNAFAPDNTRCFLLRRAGETSKYTAIAELTAGFRAKWNSYRGQMMFSYATTESGIADQFAQATHIAYGVPNETGRMEVFEIATIDESGAIKDIVAPDASSVYWRAAANKTVSERYQIPPPPDPEPEP